MNALLTDKYIRGLAQGIVLLVLTVSTLTEMIFIYYVTLRYFGLYRGSFFAKFFFQILQIPVQETFAPLVLALGGALPVIISIVCYRLVSGSNPPIADTTLNYVGRAAVTILLVAVVLGVASLALFQVAAPQISNFTDSVQRSDGHTAVHGAITSIFTFHTFFLAHLLGVKK